jgi:hypothetical protein
VVNGARPVELGLMVDVFNVFNENTPIVSQDSVGSYDVASGTFFTSPGGFGSPITIQEPRTIRLGVRMRF